MSDDWFAARGVAVGTCDKSIPDVMMSSIIAFSGSSSVQRTPASVRKHGPLFQYHRRSVASYAEQRYEYSPSVTLKELNSQAQLTCTAPVEAGEVLVTVPDSSWLDCDAVSSSSIGTATAGKHTFSYCNS